MGEAEVIIALRTFSGPNLGAEVMLPSGTYIIGTDYSCDVVLSDSSMAPRHASLTAASPQPGQRPRVHVKPLDAAIFLEDEPIPESGREIQPATPWFLGLTCLSWNTPHAPREEIVPRLSGRPTQTETAAPAKLRLAGKEQAASSSNFVGSEQPTRLSRQRRWLFRLALLLLLITSGSLIFEFRPGSPDATEEQAATLRREIQQAGLNKVVVSSSENGHITVSGSVLDEKERSLIWSMARNLNCPVYVRVAVRDDLAQAVRMKLNSNGIFPEVTFPGRGDGMRIAAYIKNIQTENAVFASLDKDMPGLPHIEKRIVYADQLKGLIERGLDQARIQNVNIVLGAGRVELTGNSSSGNHEEMQRVMQQIEDNLSIPLAYTIISQDASPGGGGSQTVQPLVSGGISPDMAASSSGKFTLEGVRVTGVTMGAMRFISLGNGQRIFEGGMLPSGHVLENINLDSLVLSKNGRTTTYPLRGNNE